MKAPLPPLDEQHPIVAEIKVRPTALNHLEQILNFSA